MKQTIKITLFTLFLIAGLQPAFSADKKRFQELKDSVDLLKAQYDTFKTKNSNLIKEISDLEYNTVNIEHSINKKKELLQRLKESKDSIEKTKSELQNFNVTESDSKKVKHDIDE